MTYSRVLLLPLAIAAVCPTIVFTTALPTAALAVRASRSTHAPLSKGAGGLASASAAQRRLPPKDESARDSAFLAFRQELLVAASRGDVNALKAAMTPTIRVLGDPETITAAELLESEGVTQGKPWTALRDALRLGGVFVEDQGQDMFVAPYYLAAAGDVFDSGEWVVVGRDVRLRATPSPSGRVVGRLSYDAVNRLNDHAADFDATSSELPSAWAHVRTDAGETGYIFVRFLRSGADKRFYFRRVEGAWKLAMFGYGD